MASKAYDKLSILQEAAEGCLARLHHSKQQLLGAHRPIVLNDDRYSKLIKAIVSSFPNDPPEKDKIPGYDTLRDNAKSITESLAYFYDTFLQVMEFKDTAFTVLEEVALSVTKLKLEENGELVVQFMDTLTRYIQVLYLQGTLGERKQLLALYAMSYQITHVSSEPYYTRLAAFVNDFWVPLRKVQKETERMSSIAGTLLTSIAITYTKLRDHVQLRNGGVLSLTLTPETMAFPAVDPILYHMTLLPRLHEWIIWCYLAMPGELASPGAIELLRLALSDGFVEPVVSAHAEMDAWLSSGFKTASFKLSAHKKVLSDAAAAAATSSGLLHRARRVYIAQELSNLLRLLSDLPGILPPKLPLVYAALAYGKAEVEWYFRHTAAPAPRAGRHRERDYHDPAVVELVRLMRALRELVLRHSRSIQRYYVEYLSGPHALRMKQLISDALAKPALVDSASAALLQQLLVQVNTNTLAGVEAGDIRDMEGFRLNWLRCLCAFSASRASPSPLVALQDLVQRMSAVVAHSRYVDRIREDLVRFTAMPDLYYNVQVVAAHYQAALQQPELIRAGLAMIALLDDFPINGNRYVPQERVSIGDDVTTRAATMFAALADRLVQLCTTLVGSEGLGALRAAVQPEAAAERFIKAATVVKLPGTESAFESRTAIARLRQAELALTALLAEVAAQPTVVVYRTAHSPIEYVREALDAFARQYIAKSVSLQGDLITRPSDIRESLYRLSALFVWLADYVEIDTGSILKAALLDTTLHTEQSRGSITLHQHPADTLVNVLIRWYLHFVDKRLLQPGSVFAAPRMGFVSLKTKSLRSDDFRPDEYADLKELEAFCCIAGTAGAHALDQRLVELVAGYARELKAVLKSNQPTLEELSNRLRDETAAAELLKRLRDVENAVALLTRVGNALFLRKTLARAVHLATRVRLPWFADTAALVARQQPPLGIGGAPDADELASEFGLDSVLCDATLRAALAPQWNDAEARALWRLLPLLTAAGFGAASWQLAEFVVANEAHVNSAHAVAPALLALSICSEAAAHGELSAESARGLVAGRMTAPLAARVRVQLSLFLSAGATIVLRALRKGGDTAEKYTGALLFLDKLVDESGSLLQESDLVACVPYTLLRSAYTQLMVAQRPERRRRPDAADAAAAGDL